MNAKYSDIRDSIRLRFIDGKPADEALPTERTLAEAFGVNRATVRRALAELEDDGLLYRIQGAGTFTIGPAVAKSLKLSSFSEEVRRRGMQPSSVVLGALTRRAGTQTARQLHVSPGEEVTEITRLRMADGEPMCIETSVFASANAPGLLERDLSGSLYALLEQDYGLRIARAEQVVTATVADEAESRQLGVPVLTPALRITRTSMDPRSRPIEHSTSLYRADRYEVRFTVRRDG